MNFLSFESSFMPLLDYDWLPSTSPSGPLEAAARLELNIASALAGMFASFELSYGGDMPSNKA